MTDQVLRHANGGSGAPAAGHILRSWARRLPIETYVIAFTIALWIALSLATPNFLTENNISNIMRQTSIAAIIAIGVMCTIVIAGIDLSVGSVAAFCGVAFAQMCGHGLELPVAAALTLIAGLGVGLINAVAIGRLGIPAFIVTLAGLQVYRGLALLLAGGMTVGGLPPEVKDFARGTTGLPNLFWAMLAVGVAVHYVLSFSRTGRYMYAMGSNAEAARRQGINTFRITVIAYLMSSGLAALGGILLVSRLSIASPSMANAYELQAIAAAVVGGASLFGGRGTVLGTVVGAILFTTMSNAAVLLGIDPFWEMVLEGLLIALVVYLDNMQKRRQAGV
ncbi:ABC transporter permease [Mesorhizobium sp. BAC0120]|uniref:ABC transporter permease n=1 Tax=Mesorhizobium sp. BAC0120 TaxID=3090670 RepID=UPI00298C2146|nr:ABC transporter permease [Mesorhizobium sp. BAC0120]MDW6026312.1 ABC transporter permease [Mesorhizobium sp. BAC0120]